MWPSRVKLLNIISVVAKQRGYATFIVLCYSKWDENSDSVSFFVGKPLGARSLRLHRIWNVIFFQRSTHRDGTLFTFKIRFSFILPLLSVCYHTCVSFENIFMGNENIWNNFMDNFPHYYGCFSFIKMLKNKLPQYIYLLLNHSFNQKIFYFAKDNHFSGNSSNMHAIYVTCCTGLNSVSPKFMSTQNLLIGLYLDIGSLQT